MDEEKLKITLSGFQHGISTLMDRVRNLERFEESMKARIGSIDKIEKMQKNIDLLGVKLRERE